MIATRGGGSGELKYVGILEHCRVSRSWAAKYAGLVEILGEGCREVDEIRPRTLYRLH